MIFDWIGVGILALLVLVLSALAVILLDDNNWF